MPGSGEIGGGSCTVKFRAVGKTPTADNTPGGDARVYDDSTGCPFDLTITVGTGGGQPTPLQPGKYKVTLNAGDEVRFSF
jgi:hypothetical protein